MYWFEFIMKCLTTKLEINSFSNSGMTGNIFSYQWASASIKLECNSLLWKFVPNYLDGDKLRQTLRVFFFPSSLCFTFLLIFIPYERIYWDFQTVQNPFPSVHHPDIQSNITIYCECSSTHDSTISNSSFTMKNFSNGHTLWNVFMGGCAIVVWFSAADEVVRRLLWISESETQIFCFLLIW